MSVSKLILRSLLHQNKFAYLPAVLQHHTHEKYGSYDDKYRSNKRNFTFTLFGSILVGSTITDDSKHKINKDQQKTEDEKVTEAGERRPDLPTFRAEEVNKHNNKNSFWVTYRHGVYDITSFLPSHPGGEQIYNAAGFSIEPFWNVYGMHKTQEVYELLESYRIGNLHEDDMVDHSDDELWAREPYRDKRLIVKTAKPFNAEIPPEYQIAYFDTPNELFYVRQHMPVPELEAGSHQVRVVVAATQQVTSLSLQQLHQLPRATVRAALMCAGNRRSEMHQQVKPVKGISWSGGAISNAVWSGVYLRDVLLHCGVDPNDTEGKHVILTGADIDATGQNFSTSIPLQLALDPNAQVLLATHMNGLPLPPDHGRPLRAVVPGAPAVRSVKWLECITVSEEESSSHWHKKDYRSFNPSTTWEDADFERAPPVYSLPVTSAVCEPRDGSVVRVRDGHIQARGYAYSGGGARILRVDVSCDRGATWRTASLQQDHAPPRTHYAWTLWTVRLPVPAHCDQMEIWVKATDSNFNTQPENFDYIWNIRGILSNAYHKIKIRLQH